MGHLSQYIPLVVRRDLAINLTFGFALVFLFFAYINSLGRTEMRTCERKERQSMRAVWDIYWDDRTRTAACRLRTATDRFTENYNTDILFILTNPLRLMPNDDVNILGAVSITYCLIALDILRSEALETTAVCQIWMFPISLTASLWQSVR